MAIALVASTFTFVGQVSAADSKVVTSYSINLSNTYDYIRNWAPLHDVNVDWDGTLSTVYVEWTDAFTGQIVTLPISKATLQSNGAIDVGGTLENDRNKFC